MSTIKQWWVTTTDNPFDPFTEFWNWYQFDEIDKRYCTTGLMARFSMAPHDAPEYTLQESNRRAVLIIVGEIPSPREGVEYKPVTRTIENPD